jgi:hypothetical protein
MRIRVFLNSLIAFLLAVGLAFGQQDRGTFVGTVYDPSGAAIPGVKVTVIHTQTNAKYETQTNEVGSYRIPNLPIGDYKIVFEIPGFKSVLRDGLRLSVTDVTRVDANMEIGQQTDSITVTAESPALQTETPEVGALLGTKQVIDMPLGFAGGRYAEDFAYRLTPGVSGNNWTSSINGSPNFSKEVVLDGASATIYIGGHMGESSVSLEAIEEFKVQTSGMSAEFARTAGGVFNFVMKSGTNQIHGSAMGQIHNEWADANSFSNNFYGRGKQRDRRHNYAFSGGGPLFLPKIYNGKDKTFWYVAYEKYHESYAGGGSPTITVPLPEWWEGNLSRYLTDEVIGQDALGRDILRGMIFDPTTTQIVDGKTVRDPFPGNIIPSSRISQVSKNLGAIYAAHYMPQIKDASGQYVLINNSFFPVSNQAGFDQKQLSVKGDHSLSANHKLSGSWAWIDRPRILLDSGGMWDFTDRYGGPLSRSRLQHVETWMARGAYDWTVSPTKLNHLLVGWNRQLNPSLSNHLGEPGAQILGITGIQQDSNYPEINFGESDRINFPQAGYQSNDLLVGNAWEWMDTFSWMRGRHSLKFGFDFRSNGLNARNNAGPGSFSFGSDVTGLPGFNQTGHSFASMLLGLVNSASVNVDTPVGSQFRMYSWFVQDDFKVNRKLTLNLGIRWDYQPQQTEKYDRLHNFNPELIDPLTGLPGAVEFAGTGTGRNGRRTFYDNSMRDYSPRVGLAYQITDKTVLRAGYGIFFNGRVPNDWSGVPYGMKYGFQQVNNVNQPNSGVPAFNWDSGYPGVVQDVGMDPSLATYLWGPVGWDPDGGRVGYTQQWNMNIQRELPAHLVLDVGYVGAKSTGLLGNQLRQINQLRPEVLQLGDILGQWIDRQEAIPAEAVAMGARYPFKEPGSWMPVQQTLQPFPQIPYWSTVLSYNSPLGFSTYNALQIQLNRRYSTGLRVMANYTFSKAIDNLESAFASWTNYGRPVDYYNLALEKSIGINDQTHIWKIGATYDMPFGRGQKFASNANRWLDMSLLGGWTLQYLGNYTSGYPIGFSGTGIPNFNNGANHALITNSNGQSLYADFDQSKFDMSTISSVNPNHKYVNTSLFTDPPRYTFGNSGYRNSQIRDFPHYSEDISIQKNINIREGVRVQLRAEFLNLFNRHYPGWAETNVASPLFGQITSVGDDRRQIHFGVRADF